MREVGEVGSAVEVAAAAVSHLWPPMLPSYCYNATMLQCYCSTMYPVEHCGAMLPSYWEGHRDILLLIRASIDQSIAFDHLIRYEIFELLC